MVEKNLNAVLLNPYLGRVIVLTITQIVWQMLGLGKVINIALTPCVAFPTEISIRQSLAFSTSLSNLCTPGIRTSFPEHTH